MPAAPPAYSLDTLSGEAAAPPYAGNAPAQVARAAAVRLAAVAPPGPWTSDRYAQVNHYTGLVYCAAKAKRDALVAATVTATKLRPRKRFKAVSSPRPHTHDEDRVPVPEGHPLAELFADPNDQDTVGDLLGDLVVQQDLHGVALLWHPLNAKGRPARLHVLPASAVQYIPPSGLYPQGGYTVTFAGTYTPLAVPGAGWIVNLDKREVLEIRDRHPRVWYGTWGPLDAGAEWVDLARGIDISQKRAFDHGFSPDVVLSIDGATSDVIDAVEAQIKARYEGRDGRKVLVADGTGIKAEKLNTTPREMDYASSKDMATKQVLALFGVNSTVAGLTDADSYASLYAKLRQFYGGTMANLCQRWSAAFTKHIARKFYGAGYAVEVAVPTPDDPDRLDKQRDAAMSAGAMTVNEYRGQLDLDPWADGDVPGFEFQAKRQQAMQPQQPGLGMGMGGDEMPPEAGDDDPAAGVADALADALAGGAMTKAAGGALVGDYTEGEVKKDKRGRRYKVVGGKRVPVGDRADEPKPKPGGGAGQRGGSADEPPVPKGHVRYYHGGHLRSQNGAGPRWFSTSREYAQGYADKSGEHGSVSFVDVPHDHPDVGRTAARWDRAGNETGWEFAPNVEFGHDIASKRRVLLAGKENATVPPANRRRQFDAGGDGPLPVSDAPAVDWRREGGGGKAVVKAAEPVMARALPTLAKRYTGPAIAKRVRSPGWAEQSAKQHAGRVARATGLDERTAAGVLLHYLERFADLVGKPFKPLANAIDFVNSDEFQGESWAATGRRLVGGAPRPANPAGAGSLPKRKAVSAYCDGAGGELVPPAVARRRVKLKRAKRFAARVVKSLGLTEATHAG